MTWGWVNYKDILIWKWTNPLSIFSIQWKSMVSKTIPFPEKYWDCVNYDITFILGWVIWLLSETALRLLLLSCHISICCCRCQFQSKHVSHYKTCIADRFRYLRDTPPKNYLIIDWYFSHTHLLFHWFINRGCMNYHVRVVFFFWSTNVKFLYTSTLWTCFKDSCSVLVA